MSPVNTQVQVICLFVVREVFFNCCLYLLYSTAFLSFLFLVGEGGCGEESFYYAMLDLLCLSSISITSFSIDFFLCFYFLYYFYFSILVALLVFVTGLQEVGKQ